MPVKPGTHGTCHSQPLAALVYEYDLQVSLLYNARALRHITLGILNWTLGWQFRIHLHNSRRQIQVLPRVFRAIGVMTHTRGSNYIAYGLHAAS